MAKRRAAGQISKDRGRDDSSSGEEEPDQGQAAPEVLARRKIAVPRTRLSKPASASLPSAPASNPFGALGGPKAPAAAPVASSANPFGFLGKAPAKEQPKSGDTSSDTLHSSQQLKLRALNANFAAQIAKANTQSPFENWESMCEKYIGYVKQILSDSDSKSRSASVEPTNNMESTSNMESANNTEDAKSQITSSGFKFGGPSVTGASTFSFGGKNVDIKKLSAAKPQQGGFVFNPNGSGEIKPGASSTAQASSDISTMKDDNSDSDSSENGKAAGSEEKEDKQEKKPAPFSFGAAAPSKTPFSFGKNVSASETKPANEAKPFTFGQANTDAAKSANAAPAFSFGKPAADSKPDDAKKPVFSFASATSNTKSDAAPSLGDANKATEKPAFSFGTAAATNSAPSSKPFSFGNSEDKPKPFTFGASSAINTGAEKPKFTFGTGASNNSGFTFGTGSNPFSTNSNDSSRKSSTGPNTSGKLDYSWTPNQPIKIASVDDESKPANNATSEGNNGEPSEEQNEPQTDLGGPGPGEEDEESVYEKKSKIFEMADGEYKPLGLGILRVLVHKESKKARILIRAEGSGRVLLNVPVRKEFKYTTVGKGQVKVLDVKPGSDTPTIYLLRVKTEDDGNELKDKLEEVKN